MLFDTHAHMDDHAFDPDREKLLSSLPHQQIGLLMNPGCSLESSRNACKLAREYDYIYAAVGSHPDAADEVNDAVLDEYRRLVRENPKVKAIGEKVFFENNDLCSITFPEGLKTIGKDAFLDVPCIICSGPARSDDNWGALSRNG